MEDQSNHSKDVGSTLAGGGAALMLLSQVKWELIPFGEMLKVVVALALLAAGYRMYKDDNKKGPQV